MKKTLLALAVLGTVGAVHAQTAVVIDGSIDTSVMNRAAASGANTTTMEKNQRNTNYIGISGTEDLGKGLKAMFQIRTGFGSDDQNNGSVTPTTANTGSTSIGDQNVWLGLQGGFGTVKLGRDLTPQFMHVAAYSVFGTGFLRNFASMNSGTASARWNNAVSYTTPTMSGFAAQIMTASRYEVSGAATTIAGTPLGTPLNARLSYGAGPLSVGAAFLRNGAAPESIWNVGGAYNFGVATLKAQYERDNNTVGSAGNRNGWLVGAEGALPGTAMVLKAQYAKRSAVGATGSGVTAAKAFGLGADYNLSKRTTAYLYYGKVDLAVGGNRDTVLGVRHGF
jgi:predicted porin